tara:strand:+ start:11780 stop:12418 length:639 start_codon:yes stop_codon:yes gene_type:complete
MASRAGIDAKAAVKLAEEHQNIVFAVEASFDTAIVRLHSGAGTLTINGNNYEGAGTLLAISDIEDSKELKSSGVSFNLSGMDTTLLNYALTENYQNRPIIMYMAFISGGTNHVDGVMTVYSGRMIQIRVGDSASGSTIAINSENRLIDLMRPSNIRYTNESQQSLYAGDTSLNEVAAIQDMKLMWGRKGINAEWGGEGNGNEPWTDETRPRG